MQLYMPTDVLNTLIDATGFDSGGFSLGSCGGNYEYKLRWLLERIKIMKDGYDAWAIIHDKPEITDLIAVIKDERRWTAAIQNTLDTLLPQLEAARAELRQRKAAADGAGI